jgi:hypothetical protein
MKVSISFAERTFDWYLERLEGIEQRGERDVLARCPAHDDGRPSLHVLEDAQGLLVHCFAGCSRADVDEALEDMAPSPKPVVRIAQRRERGEVVARYDYRNAVGDVIFRKLRLEPKSFEFRRPVIVPARTEGPVQHSEFVSWRPGLKDTEGRYVVEPVPYNLPELLNTTTPWIVDGEKDADRLATEGAVATCSPYGMARWRPEFSEYLCGAEVVVVADRDEPGRRAASKLATALREVASSVRVVEAAEGKDAFDHLEAGLSLDEFVEVALDG